TRLLADVEDAPLLSLHLMGDTQDLEVLRYRRLMHIDPDDLLVALLERLLVGERSIGDLRHEPAVLDAPQDAASHGADAVRGRLSHVRDAGEDRLGLPLQ